MSLTFDNPPGDWLSALKEGHAFATALRSEEKVPDGEVRLAQPIRVYIVSSGEAEDLPPSKWAPSLWRSLTFAGDVCFAAVDFLQVDNYFDFVSMFGGKSLDNLSAALEAAVGLGAGEERYEVRILEFPELFVAAVWLVAEAGKDIIIPWAGKGDFALLVPVPDTAAFLASMKSRSSSLVSLFEEAAHEAEKEEAAKPSPQAASPMQPLESAASAGTSSEVSKP